MKVAVAFDHRGVHLREAVLEALVGHEILDFGTDTDAVRIDYPDKAREIGEAIQRGEAVRGVLVCGSGVGASVAACNTFQPSRSNSAQIAFFTLTSSSMTSTVRIVRVLQFRIVVLERRVKEQQAQRSRWNWTLGTFYQGLS